MEGYRIKGMPAFRVIYTFGHNSKPGRNKKKKQVKQSVCVPKGFDFLLDNIHFYLIFKDRFEKQLYL